MHIQDRLLLFLLVIYKLIPRGSKIINSVILMHLIKQIRLLVDQQGLSKRFTGRDLSEVAYKEILTHAKDFEYFQESGQMKDGVYEMKSLLCKETEQTISLAIEQKFMA